MPIRFLINIVVVVNILRYFLFGIAGSQEVDRTFF